jgi:predicted ferric reductase
MRQAIGTLALAALVALCRRYFYEFFVWSHYLLSAAAVYALWNRFHTLRRERITLIVAISLHGAITLLRLAKVAYRNTLRKSQWSRARITRRDEALIITLPVPRPWIIKPPQYIYLWIPWLSFRSLFQTHPFSVAWWSENEEGQATSVSLLVKPQHGLTNRLMRSSRNEFRVAIDGPYGKSIDTSRYGTLILLATGVGIAAQIPLIKQALAEYKAGRTSIQRIRLIWQMEYDCEFDQPNKLPTLTFNLQMKRDG